MAKTLQSYYKEKKISYFSSDRDDIFNVLTAKSVFFDRALEVGCGNGELLHDLKEANIIGVAVGIDPFGTPKADSLIDNFYPQGIQEALPYLDNEYKFDLIIFADVLEHLEDPWDILNNICNKHLSDNGTVVISIPNLRNLQSLFSILYKNSFEYQSEGVFDKTHLRFFCKKDVENMIQNAGLSMEFLTPNFKHKKSVFFKKNRLKYVNMFTFNLIPFWLSDQIIAVAKKNNINER